MNYSDWNKCYCEVCGDGSRTKGPRGGWLFNGDMAFYRCFNCGCKGSFDPNRDFPICKDMRKVLVAFGIDPKDAMFLSYKNKMADEKSSESSEDEEPVVKPYINLYVKTYDTPDYFYPLLNANNDIAVAAREKLWEKYGLKDTSYPFYLSSGVTKSDDPKEKLIAKALMNRIIIPYFKKDELMYYQGRSLEDSDNQRYLNMNVPKTNIIFNIDALYRDFDRPLFIFEGAMDAIHVDGVAVMENNLSASQIEILNRSSRRKVIVPDVPQHTTKVKENRLIQLGVFEQGWGIAIPELGTGSKDLCEGIKRYGKLFVLKSLMENTFFGNEAKMRANLLNY